jgi:hypothetical protein
MLIERNVDNFEDGADREKTILYLISRLNGAGDSS